MLAVSNTRPFFGSIHSRALTPAYSGDVNGRFQRDVNRHSGDVNKVGAQRRWDDNDAETFRINQGGARSLFSIIVSFPFLSLFRL
jgi:hypothetical protein